MNNIKIALCKEGSEKYGLTADRYYIVQDQCKDLLDGVAYMYVLNDNKASVNVKASRFGGVVGVSPVLWATLNKK